MFNITTGFFASFVNTDAIIVSVIFGLGSFLVTAFNCWLTKGDAMRIANADTFGLSKTEMVLKLALTAWRSIATYLVAMAYCAIPFAIWGFSVGMAVMVMSSIVTLAIIIPMFHNERVRTWVFNAMCPTL